MTDFMPSEVSKMNHSDFLSQMDKWEAALDRVESLEHGTEVIKPVVESFREPGIDMIGVLN